MKIGCYGAIEFQGLRGNCEEQFFKSTASSLWVNKKTTGSRNKKNIGWEKQNFSPYAALNVAGFYQTPNNMVQLLQHSTANIQPLEEYQSRLFKSLI